MESTMKDLTTTPALHKFAEASHRQYSIVRATRASRVGAVILAIVTITLLATPWWADRSSMRFATEFLYVLALAQMWNLLTGFGGVISIGQQAFIGIGAYALVFFTTEFGLNPFLAVPLAGLVAGVLAFPTAAIVFRLQGAYFAVGTWVVAETFRLLVANSSWLGDGSGVSITSAFKGISPWWREASSIWIAVVLGLGSTVLLYLVLRSRFGLALKAIRDSEPASESLGIKVNATKWIMYVASCVGCGCIGALIFITKLRVSPDAAFSLDWTTTMLFVVVIGGIGTVEGPIVGAIIYFALRSVLADYGSLYLITLGAFAIVIVLKQPQGLWGYVANRYGITFFPVQRKVILEDNRPGGSK